MPPRGLALVTLVVLGCSSKATPPPPPAAHPPTEDAVPAPLQPVAAYAGIGDRAARSRALFAEAARVLTHPRCTNCHPSDGVPRQGLDQRPHEPRVTAGAEGHGGPGLPCASCHQEANVTLVGATLASVPGNPKWALAPAAMAWVGRSPGAICEQLKDPARNGGRDLEAIHHHLAHDELVGWGWAPGPGRQPAPGTQRALGELIRGWIDAGAACPAP